MNPKEESIQSIYARLETANPKDGWLILGPGGGGCVHLLTINPQRPETLLVSCDMTAGYISHDSGRSWREFNLKSRQYAYAFDPSNPDVIYAGSSSLFRSVDNGRSWRLLFPRPEAVRGETHLGDEANHNFLSEDNWPGRSVHAILVDPLQPAHLFIVIKKEGARQPEHTFHSPPRNSLLLFSSADHGLTWRTLATLDAEEIHRLALDPVTPVGARMLYAFTEAGLVRIESGASFSSTPLELPLPAGVVAVRHACTGFNPESGKTVFYLSTLARPEEGRCKSEIWKSTDLGLNWSRCRTGLEGSIPGDPPVFSQVSACEKDARRAYLIAERFPEQDVLGQHVVRHGILRSCDEGASWEWVVKMDDDHDPRNRVGGWAERDYGAKWGDLKGEQQISPKGRFAWDVVASPVEPDVCYTMDFSTIFETTNGGGAWQQLVTHLHPDGSASSRGIDVLSVYDVVFDPFDPDHIALPVTDAGVFHSFNRGRTWQHALDGVPRTWINTCYAIVFDPEVKGRAWSAWSAVHDIPRIKIFVQEHLSEGQGGICRTDDGLQTWQPCAKGLPENAHCTHLLLDPASPADARKLYAAVFGYGVYRSNDSGRTWMSKNSSLDPANPFAWRMAQQPDGTLYLVVVKNQLKGSVSPGALYRSVDGAETWVRIPLPEHADFPNDLVCDSHGRLYLACWPQAASGQSRGGGAYCSEDGGHTWQEIFDPRAHVYSLAVDPRKPGRLYLTTFTAGSYRSDDCGQNWQRLKGYNFQWCYRPVPDPLHPQMLYLTTFGSSIWYGPAAGVPDALEDIVMD